MGIMTSDRSKAAAESACCRARGGAGSNRTSASSEETCMGREASRPRQRAANARRAALPVDPVRQLHEEGVVGPQAEQIAQVAAEAARALGAVRLLTPLTPYHEQRRAGPVLPAQHDVGVELLVVESFAERGVAVRYVAARADRRARRGRKPLLVAVRSLPDERPRLDLERPL